EKLINLFVDIPEAITYTDALVYANTIDEVPLVVDELKAEEYSAKGKESQIKEIQQQDRSLTLLVFIVAGVVFLFGVITVVSVLLDSTERKKSTLGIMRVMGVTRRGIFYMVFLRSTVIALLAALLTIVFGYSSSILLSPWISIEITIVDLGLVLVGALLCCAFGSLWPARRASKMDPFDAIVEGRFR
ncbi:MAG: FtsX-like permease family protein, partial [Planctomycetota bacterium]